MSSIKKSFKLDSKEFIPNKDVISIPVSRKITIMNELSMLIFDGKATEKELSIIAKQVKDNRATFIRENTNTNSIPIEGAFLILHIHFWIPVLTCQRFFELILNNDKVILSFTMQRLNGTKDPFIILKPTKELLKKGFNATSPGYSKFTGIQINKKINTILKTLVSDITGSPYNGTELQKHIVIGLLQLKDTKIILETQNFYEKEKIQIEIVLEILKRRLIDEIDNISITKDLRMLLIGLPIPGEGGWLFQAKMFFEDGYISLKKLPNLVKWVELLNCGWNDLLSNFFGVVTKKLNIYLTSSQKTIVKKKLSEFFLNNNPLLFNIQNIKEFLALLVTEFDTAVNNKIIRLESVVVFKEIIDYLHNIAVVWVKAPCKNFENLSSLPVFTDIRGNNEISENNVLFKITKSVISYTQLLESIKVDNNPL